MKKIIKIIVFIFIFCIIWYYIFSVLRLPKNNVSMLYDEPKNSMDIIYIGGSNAHHHFNSLLAYELYGFTTGFLATGSQPFISIKYLIMESQKYQKPDLYIIDLTRI